MGCTLLFKWAARLHVFIIASPQLLRCIAYDAYLQVCLFQLIFVDMLTKFFSQKSCAGCLVNCFI